MKSVAIECKGLKKSYGAKDTLIKALDDVDLQVYSNELTLLVGPSGSGKTTLLSIITSISTPDEGELLLLGKKINEMRGDEKAIFCRDNLGIVFQSLFLVPTLTVLENVALPLLIAGVGPIDANKKAIETLKTLNMDHRVNESPAILSKGQQQRVAIARAIVNDSKIIVCDEPTSALDHTAGMEVMGILHDLAKLSGKAVLVVTHDQRIFSFADRIINISDGKIL